MTEFRDVHAQCELEAALAAEGVVPVCRGEGHFFIPISSGSATVEASGSATVEAYGSATVEAYDSATVEAYGSATVRASGSATVEAYDSATVEAYDSATVEAYDSATVRAYDSATVRAYGSATVRASGSATVEAYDSATVRATPYVAVHQHSPHAAITGGHVIRVPDWDTATVEEWAAYTGLTPDDGALTVYKAVGADLVSDHGMSYPVDGTVTAPDWQPIRECGSGLHFSQAPRHARRYHNTTGVRFLAVRVQIGEVTVLGHDKIKARSCVVLHEVDIDGRPVTTGGVS